MIGAGGFWLKGLKRQFDLRCTCKSIGYFGVLIDHRIALIDRKIGKEEIRNVFDSHVRNPNLWFQIFNAKI